MTKSATSRKSKLNERPAGNGRGAAPRKARPPLPAVEKDSEEFLDEAIPVLRKAILRQMKENRTKPRTIEAANKRARDSSTLAGLVRTLERLNALDKSREGKNKKAKARNGAELKERFVRRLDQFLAAGTEGEVSGKPERG